MAPVEVNEIALLPLLRPQGEALHSSSLFQYEIVRIATLSAHTSGRTNIYTKSVSLLNLLLIIRCYFIPSVILSLQTNLHTISLFSFIHQSVLQD